MKIFDLRSLAKTQNGEYILGAEDTGSHACYMIYGILKPSEKGRVIRPGAGHEEIIIAINGDIHVTGDYTLILDEGKAFHITGEQTCYLENKADTEVIYIIAGGHSENGHHHS